MEDLQRYGTVKRGILGVSFPAPSTEDQFFLQKGLTPGSVKGVYITGVSPEGAAAAAGLREGDIIQSIDGFQLNSSSEFSERIARRRPGETTQITYLRDGKPATVSVVLKGEETARATDRTAASLQNIHERLGASFEPLTSELKQRYNLDRGVVVTEVRRGGFFEELGIPAGTIIAFINGKAIASTKDIDDALLSAERGMIQILAIDGWIKGSLQFFFGNVKKEIIKLLFLYNFFYNKKIKRSGLQSIAKEQPIMYTMLLACL